MFLPIQIFYISTRSTRYGAAEVNVGFKLGQSREGKYLPADRHLLEFEVLHGIQQLREVKRRDGVQQMSLAQKPTPATLTGDAARSRGGYAG